MSTVTVCLRRRCEGCDPGRGWYPADSRAGTVAETGNTVYLKFEGMNPTGSFKTAV